MWANGYSSSDWMTKASQTASTQWRWAICAGSPTGLNQPNNHQASAAVITIASGIPNQTIRSSTKLCA